MTTTTMMTTTTTMTTMKQQRKGDASLFACRTCFSNIPFSPIYEQTAIQTQHPNKMKKKKKAKILNKRILPCASFPRKTVTSIFSLKAKVELMAEFESESEFVAAGVEVLRVDEGGKSQLDSRAEVLSVRDAQLTAVVNLGSEAGVSINSQFARESESSGVGSIRPGKVHACLEVSAELLVERSDEFGAIVDCCVDLEISGAITEGEVALRQFASGTIKCKLVSTDPSFVSKDSSAVDSGSGEVDVDVGSKMGLLEGRLDDSRSFSTCRREGCLQCQL